MSSRALGSGGWKDAAFGVAYLAAVGIVFTGVVAGVSVLVAGH